MKSFKLLLSGTLVLTATLGLCLLVQIASASPVPSRILGPAEISYTEMAVDGMLVAPVQTDVKVMKAVVCSSISEREPVGVASSFSKDIGRVYCYSRIEMPKGSSETIQHIWKRNGKTISTVDLTVKGPAYRTRSYKTITSRMAGDWTVEIRDGSGQLLETVAFSID